MAYILINEKRGTMRVTIQSLLWFVSFLALGLLIIVQPLLAQSEQPTIVYWVDWRLDGKGLAVSTNNGVWLYDDTLQNPQQVSEGITGVVSWSPDANRIAVDTTIWNVQSLQPLVTLQSQTSLFRMNKHWSQDGSQIATLRYDQLGIQIFDTLTGEILSELSGSVEGQWIISVDWSPDETRFAVSRADRSIAIFDVATGGITAVYPQQEIVDAIAWSPDSTLFAGIIAEFVSNDTPGSIPTAGQNILVSIYVWDAATGEVVQTISGLGEYANMLRWNPNGNELANGAPNGLVEIWDVNTGQQITSLLSSGILNGMDYSPYGARLAFANNPAALEYSAESRAAEVVVDYAMQSLAGGALDIVVPDPSVERLQAIQAACMTAPAVATMDVQTLTLDALPEYVAQVEALTDAEIPPGCAADLVAIAEALIAEGQ